MRVRCERAKLPLATVETIVHKQEVDVHRALFSQSLSCINITFNWPLMRKVYYYA